MEIHDLIESSKVDFTKFIKILVFLMKANTLDESEKTNFDYIDAFVAFGGDNDGSGFVEIEVIEKALKDFELNIDLTEVLNKLGINNNELDYTLFCKLFDTPIFADN